MAWQALRFVLAFGLVLLAAALGSRWLAGRARGAQSPGLRLLGGLSLGGGRALCAVEVGRRVLVLGLGDRQVHLLATLTDPEEVSLLASSGAGPGTRLVPFATTLAEALGRRGAAAARSSTAGRRGEGGQRG